MSYASAVLYGVSSDEKPVSPPKPQVQAPPKQQVQAPKPQEEEKREEAPQQPKVVLKLEGNDGGELGQLFRDEKNHVYTRKGDEDKKKNVKTDRIFDAVISYLEPVDVSALGRTCKYFLTKVLKNKNITNNLYDPRQKVSKPAISLKVDYKGEEDKEVKNFTLSYFSDPRRQTALCKFWATVVEEAQGRNVNSNDVLSIVGEKPVDVKLPGGLFFAGKQGPLVVERDLSRTSAWLAATVQLLQGKTQVDLPYLEGGKVLLTRYGLGGAKIKVQTVLPGAAKSEEGKKGDSVHRYDFAEFCMALRTAAKGLVPLAGTSAVSMKQGVRNVSQEEAESYLQREKILSNLLKHQQLNQAIKEIKKKLVPHPELHDFFRKRREEKLRVNAQIAIENENIKDFVASNLPEDFEQAKLQAVKIGEETERQRELEKEERRRATEERKLKFAAEKEAARAAKSKKDTSTEDSSELEKKSQIKRKVVKVVDDDGFVLEKVVMVKKDGEEIERAEKEVVVVKKKEVAVDALSNNPYAATLRAAAYTSVAEEQHRFSMARVKGREMAEEKKRAQINKEKKLAKAAAAAAAPQKNQKGKQGQKQPQKQQQKGQQAKAQPEKKVEQPVKETKPVAQPKQAAKNTQKKAQKKSPKTNKPKKPQAPVAPESQDIFQPTAIALTVVGVLAFGYVLVSGAF